MDKPANIASADSIGKRMFWSSAWQKCTVTSRLEEDRDLPFVDPGMSSLLPSSCKTYGIVLQYVWHRLAIGLGYELILLLSLELMTSARLLHSLN